MVVGDSELYSRLVRVEYSGANMGVDGQRKDSDLRVVGKVMGLKMVVRGGGLLLLGLATAGGQEAGHRWSQRRE